MWSGLANQLTFARDRKDNILLELAASGDADYLITGDRDLLVLNPFRGTEILTPREFLDKVIGK